MPWIAANHKKERRRFGVDRRPGEADPELPHLADCRRAYGNSHARARHSANLHPRTDFHQFAFLEVIDPLRS